MAEKRMAEKRMAEKKTFITMYSTVDKDINLLKQVIFMNRKHSSESQDCTTN